MVDIADAVVAFVEDDVLNAALLTKLLSICGVKRIIGCCTGAELREALAGGEIVDLVLVDLQLPHEDGYQILASLLAQPGLEHARIVAASANVLPVDVQKARDVGFMGFLGKPFDFDQFSDQIRRILEGACVWDPR
ncbi:MAG: response regulator [Anaerolineae bacterium]|nr:response regulator [Anaerolineae bacterium]